MKKFFQSSYRYTVIFPIITQRSYEQLNPICGFQRGKLSNKKVTQLDYQITTNSSSPCNVSFFAIFGFLKGKYL
jgi:hypothetical protein